MWMMSISSFHYSDKFLNLSPSARTGCPSHSVCRSRNRFDCKAGSECGPCLTSYKEVEDHICVKKARKLPRNFSLAFKHTTAHYLPDSRRAAILILCLKSSYFTTISLHFKLFFLEIGLYFSGIKNDFFFLTNCYILIFFKVCCSHSEKNKIKILLL